MRFSACFRVLGILLMIFSISMLPPIGVSLWYHDGAEISFITAFSITIVTGFLIWFPFHGSHHDLKTRDGFLVVTLFWVVLSFFGAIPMYIDFFPTLSFSDAMFESTSGLTTTGATVLTHLQDLPHAVLYYRQQLHLLGGMGIIVLAVAILPMLGIGGMQMYRAETVGPIKTTKLRPRMTQTAKALWYIYAVLVIACAFSYWLAGMSLFDAIGESFSTVATGGFSTHDSSFAFYHSTLINCIAIIFMLLGATNFALHFQAVKNRHLSIYFKDYEFRSYLTILAIVIFIIWIVLLVQDDLRWAKNLLNSIFTVVSLSTTTGFTTVNFSIWPTFVPYLIMFIALLGGCGGSTSGGIKIMRVLALEQQGRRELKRLIHPHSVLALRFGQQILPEEVIQAIWGFAAVFISLFVILLLMILATGLDLKTAFGAIAACLSNTGASIGGVASNYKHIPVASKWILIFAMFAGRLEIFTILVLFTRSYWRR